MLPHAIEDRFKMPSGTSGDVARFSTAVKTAKRTMAAASDPRVNGSVQECSAAFVRLKTRARSPRVTVIAPGTSKRAFVAGLLSASTTGAISNTAIATGTLMKNAQRQLRRSVSRPPRIAPVVKPAAMREPFRPRALSRRGPSGNASRSRASAAGTTIAVATPWPTRATSSSAGSAARPPAKEEIPSSAMPRRKSLRRPARSAIRPKRSVRPAAHRANAVAIH